MTKVQNFSIQKLQIELLQVCSNNIENLRQGLSEEKEKEDPNLETIQFYEAEKAKAEEVYAETARSFVASVAETIKYVAA